MNHYKRYLLPALFAFFMLLPLSAGAQSFGWARKAGSTANERGLAVTTDTFGNIYVTGEFSGTVDFDPGPNTYLLGTAGVADAFVLKLSPSGGFIWARSFGSSGAEYGNSIAVDHIGSVFVGGVFMNTVDFDPGPGTHNLTASASNGFIVKLDATGSFLGAAQFESGFLNNVLSLAIDGQDNVIVSGNFSGNTDFNPGSATYYATTTAPNAGYVTKLTNNLGLVWVATATSATTSGNCTPRSLAVDASGDIYTTGPFNGTIDFDPGWASSNLTAITAGSAFIWKLDNSGNISWAKKLDKVSGALGDIGTAVAAGAAHIYLSGRFANMVDFDPGPGSFPLSGPGTYFLKLDLSGDFVWARAITSGSIVETNHLVLDANEQIYSCGYFTGTADFDPGTAVNNLVALGNDAFVLKMDSAGNYGNVFIIGGNATERTMGVAGDHKGSVYSTGYFNGTADFDPGTGSFPLSTTGSNDIFIQRLGSCSAAPPVPAGIGGQASACPIQQTYYVSNPSSSAAGYTWTLPPGWAGTSTTDSITVTPSGSGTISVAAVNNCGSSPAASLAVTVNSLPAQPLVQITGNTTFCAGGQAHLSVTNPGAGLSYSWANNGITITGAAGTSLTVNTSGSYTAVASNGNCPASSAPVVINVMPVPVVTVSPANPKVCTGDTTLVYAVPGSYSYQWKQNGNIISGNTTAAMSLYSGMAGTYTITVYNGICFYNVPPFVVTEVTPASVNLSLVGGQLVATPGFGSYSWYENGHLDIITPGNIYPMAPLHGFSYHVVVTDTAGCTPASNTILINGVEEKAVGNGDAVFYPNPSDGRVNIRSQEPFIRLTVTDVAGRVVLEQQPSGSDVSFLLQTPGVYFVTLRYPDRTVQEKLLVQ